MTARSQCRQLAVPPRGVPAEGARGPTARGRSTKRRSTHRGRQRNARATVRGAQDQALRSTPAIGSAAGNEHAAARLRDAHARLRDGAPPRRGARRCSRLSVRVAAGQGWSRGKHAERRCARGAPRRACSRGWICAGRTGGGRGRGAPVGGSAHALQLCAQAHKLLVLRRTASRHEHLVSDSAAKGGRAEGHECAHLLTHCSTAWGSAGGGGGGGGLRLRRLVARRHRLLMRRGGPGVCCQPTPCAVWRGVSGTNGARQCSAAHRPVRRSPAALGWCAAWCSRTACACPAVRPGCPTHPRGCV